MIWRGSEWPSVADNKQPAHCTITTDVSGQSRCSLCRIRAARDWYEKDEGNGNNTIKGEDHSREQKQVETFKYAYFDAIAENDDCCLLSRNSGETGNSKESWKTIMEKTFYVLKWNRYLCQYWCGHLHYMDVRHGHLRLWATEEDTVLRWLHIIGC